MQIRLIDRLAMMNGSLRRLILNETKERMKKAIVFHARGEGDQLTPCPDGIAAAAIAYSAIGDDNTDVLPRSYYELREGEGLEGYDAIYIVDFSFDADIIRRLREHSNVVILDHHQNAMESLLSSLGSTSLWRSIQEGKSNNFHVKKEGLALRFDNLKCGAELAWEFFYPNTPVPAFVRYVGDRDLWKNELPYTGEIYEAIAQRRSHAYREGGELAVFEMYRSLFNIPYWEFVEQFAQEGVPLYLNRLRLVEELTSSPDQVFRLDLNKVGDQEVVSCLAIQLDSQTNRYASDVCHELLGKFPDYSVAVAVVSVSGEEKYELRSRQGSDADCSAIARYYGGNGHFHAAGFKSNGRIRGR